MSRITTDHKPLDMTRQYRTERTTPVALRGIIRQAKQHFASTGSGVRAAYRGWTARPIGKGIQQIVQVQVERPGALRPIQRLRGYGRVTLHGTTSLGVRRNKLVDL